MKRAAAVRTERLIGREGCARLAGAHVMVVGIGGVGSYAAEALARGGVGTLTLVDFDVVSESNINRQLVALYSTIGRQKTAVMRERILEINPEAIVNALHLKYSAETADQLDLSTCDYLVDAIDMVPSKVELIVRAKNAGKPVISSMGAGNKLDPAQFIVTDLFGTENCPLARIMRKKLRKRGVDSLEVVFSPETPRDIISEGSGDGGEASKKIVPGSISFVPSVAGLMAAGVVIRRLAGV